MSIYYFIATLCLFWPTCVFLTLSLTPLLPPLCPSCLLPPFPLHH